MIISGSLFLSNFAGTEPVKDASGGRSAAPEGPLAQTVSGQARHRLRRYARVSDVASCFYSWDSAGSRRPSSPASTSVPRSLPLGRSGPGPGGRLPTLRAGLFRCSREPEVSLPPRSRARRPHAARPPPRPTLRCAPCPWSLADLQAAPASMKATMPATSPAPTSLPARLPTTKADRGTYAPWAVRIRAPYHARRTVQGVIYTQQGAAAEAAAASLQEYGIRHLRRGFHSVEITFKKLHNCL